MMQQHKLLKFIPKENINIISQWTRTLFCQHEKSSIKTAIMQSIRAVIIRGVTIRRATIRYVSRYVGRDTTNDTISDDTPTNLESQTHFS